MAPRQLARCLRLTPPMSLITVVSEHDAISAQARTYAEYRVFAVMARYTRTIRRVRVVLRHAGAGGTGGMVTCAVTITLDPSGVIRTRASGPHVYAAINRAIERLAHALGRRIEHRLSSREGEPASAASSGVCAAGLSVLSRPGRRVR